jgi:hypothetical protein
MQSPEHLVQCCFVANFAILQLRVFNTGWLRGLQILAKPGYNDVVGPVSIRKAVKLSSVSNIHRQEYISWASTAYVSRRTDDGHACHIDGPVSGKYIPALFLGENSRLEGGRVCSVSFPRVSRL